MAAAAIFVAGLVHLQLYFDGYRNVPNANLGRSFLLNGVASVVIAAVLVFHRHWMIRAAGIVLVAGTLLGSALSRTDSGVFGFTERGWGPLPQGPLALATELLALVLLAATFVPAIGEGVDLELRIALPAAAAAVVGTVALAALWNRSPERPAEAGGASTVDISNFEFLAPEIRVETGEAITWTNRDGFPHSVLAEDERFGSDPLESGEQFSFTFDTPGTYRYICGIHPTMSGTVIVDD